MMEVFYLIAFLLLPLRTKQFINNGRRKFPPVMAPPTQDIITHPHHRSEHRAEVGGGGGVVLEGPGKFLNSKRGKKN